MRSAPRVTRRRIRSRPRFELAEEAAEAAEDEKEEEAEDEKEEEAEEEAEEEEVARRCTWAIRLGGKKLTAANSSAPNRARAACFSSSPSPPSSYSSSSPSLAPPCASIVPLAPFASLPLLSLLLL